MSLRKIFVGLTAFLMANSVFISVGFAQETNQNQGQNVQKNADSAEVSPEEILKIEETVDKELKELEKKQASNQKAENKQTEPQKENNQESASPKSNEVKTDSAKTEENQQTADSKVDAKEENVATVTAEGDFVVPTYMLPAKEDLETAPQNNVAENKAPDNKVVHQSTVKITQTELIPVAEQMEVERFFTGKTTKTMKAYKEALARQKAAQKAAQKADNDSKTAQASDKKAEESTEKNAENIDSADVEALIADESQSKKASTPKKRLLLPLRPLPSKTPPAEDLSGTEPLFKVVSSTMADQVLKDAQDQTQSSLLMPQDIKVTFYPDSAEFSGQTVKWIKAFALQALNDPRRVVEIRLSQYNPIMQQKRLSVVQRLLMNSGLSAHQIVVDYVNRPSDSLILRTVEKTESVQKRKIELKNGKVKENETINW